MSLKVLVAGCGVAGFSAARKLKELDPSAQVSIADKEGIGLYTKIRLPEYLAGKLPASKLVLNGPEAIEKLGVKLLAGRSVASFDAARHEAKLDDGSLEGFDALVIASGADASNPCLKDCGSIPVFTMRTIADADAIGARAAKARSAVVIGGGLLGLEAAWALKARNLEVSVVECLPRLLPRNLDETESAILLEKMASMGFSFHVGRKLACAAEKGGRGVLRLDDGAEIVADLALVAAGIKPRIGLAAAAGLETGRGVKVDARLETKAKGIFAIGDCAELPDGRIWGLWAASKDQGEALGEILAGRRETFASPVYAPSLKVSGVQMKEIRAEAESLRARRVS